MDELSQKEFNRIVALKSDDLTSNDISFLFARREYLNKSQVAEFADIIKAKQAQIESDTEVSEPKKGK
jgi:hypothetical protein